MLLLETGLCLQQQQAATTVVSFHVMQLTSRHALMYAIACIILAKNHSGLLPKVMAGPGIEPGFSPCAPKGVRIMDMALLKRPTNLKVLTPIAEESCCTNHRFCRRLRLMSGYSLIAHVFEQVVVLLSLLIIQQVCHCRCLSSEISKDYRTCAPPLECA